MLKKYVMSFAIIYLAILTFLFLFQRNLQYQPMGKIMAIANYDLDGFESHNLTSSNQIKILAWYKPPQEKQKIILYFHGNGGNMADRAHKFKTFANAGFGIMAISYRGYPNSQGKASEAGLIQDAKAALNFLLQKKYQLQDIIFYGESLGSAVAVQLAAKFSPHAIILESPPSSITSVAQQRYWFVPVNLLLKDKFESIKFAPKITTPTLIIHGTNDKVVNYKEGKTLFEAFNVRKKLITIKGAGHLEFDEQFLVGEIEEFINYKK